MVKVVFVVVGLLATIVVGLVAESKRNTIEWHSLPTR